MSKDCHVLETLSKVIVIVFLLIVLSCQSKQNKSFALAGDNRAEIDKDNRILYNVKTIALLLLILSLSIPACSGNLISLKDAIEIYVYNTNYICEKRLTYENSLLEYDNYKKSLLPSVSLNLTPVSFNHSLRLLQNYNNGEYSNVEEFSNTSSGDVSISQRIAATGGTFSIGSSINYLREFTSDNNSFSASPMYFSYSQSLFGSRKNFVYERTISRLKYDMALKDFCSSVSTEQQKILTLYLDAFSKKMDIDFYTKAVSIGDSLLMHARIRKESGKITEYEYNQVELQQLDNKMELEKSQYAFKSAIRKLENELLVQNIKLESPSTTDFPKYIEESNVLGLVRKNNPTYQNQELSRLNAEYSLHQKKISNRFNANISLSYGLNQYAKTLREAYRHPDQRQSVSVTFTIPMFQWGANRNRIKIAENNYESALLDQEASLDKFKEEIHDNVFNYNMSRELTEVANRKYQLSGQQYSFAATRFCVGKIAAIELINASKEYMQAKQNYLSVLRSLFVNYYKIRHMSLYDFIEGRNLTELIQTVTVQ